jgi:hypothetical protein
MNFHVIDRVLTLSRRMPAGCGIGLLDPGLVAGAGLGSALVE